MADIEKVDQEIVILEGIIEELRCVVLFSIFLDNFNETVFIFNQVYSCPFSNLNDDSDTADVLNQMIVAERTVEEQMAQLDDLTGNDVVNNVVS